MHTAGTVVPPADICAVHAALVVQAGVEVASISRSNTMQPLPAGRLNRKLNRRGSFTTSTSLVDVRIGLHRRAIGLGLRLGWHDLDPRLLRGNGLDGGHRER